MDVLTRMEAFMATRHNYVPQMGWESGIMDAVGLSIDQTRFMMALFFSIPAGLAVKALPTGAMRHLYSAIIGFALVYYPFGFGVIHAAAPSVLVYLAVALVPSACGTLAWAICFPYLLYLHVVNASGANWQAGILDFTGCEMVLVLKLITFAVCRQDAWQLRKSGRELSHYQSQHSYDGCPDPLRYLSFVFGLGNLLAGPYLEYVDYRDFMEGRGLWDKKAKPIPSPWWHAAKCIGEACFYMALYQAIVPTWNGDLVWTDWYTQSNFWVKMLSLFMLSFTCQVKFVFAWKISEASLTLAGLNFAGWDSAGAGSWGRYENVRFITMLMSDSARIVVSHWNIGTSKFLRRYVYERLTAAGRKPGFPQLLATQLVSAIWHGLYPGYLLFFAGSAFWLNFATVIHKAEQALLPPVIASSLPLRAIKIVWTHLCLNSVSVCFIMLELKPSLQVWASVHYVPMAIIVLGSALSPFLPGGKRSAKHGAARKAKDAKGGEAAVKKEE
ncbi:hypothetical protein FOA52_012119 [Chlamydomonas sp. UWO 241]|nr:hypothetical protein FOA52_012119 [Chlamydomonas sp. UWO 241]